jgi:hypothetical protein
MLVQMQEVCTSGVGSPAPLYKLNTQVPGLNRTHSPGTGTKHVRPHPRSMNYRHMCQMKIRACRSQDWEKWRGLGWGWCRCHMFKGLLAVPCLWGQHSTKYQLVAEESWWVQFLEKLEPIGKGENVNPWQPHAMSSGYIQYKHRSSPSQ